MNFLNVIKLIILYLSWLQLVLAVWKTQGFKRTTLASYEIVEVVQSPWANSYLACCTFCTTLPSCHGVIYNEGPNCTAITNVIIDENGQDEAMVMDNLRKPCILDKWDFGDYEDNIEGLQSLQECHDKCKQEDDCTYWSYSAEDEDCYLAKETQYKSGYYDEYFVAGPIYCPIDWDCFYLDVAFEGYDIKPGQAASDAKECQKLCQAETECEYWLYKERECKMKSQLAIENEKYEQGSISGPKNCPDLNLPMIPADCFYPKMVIQNTANKVDLVAATDAEDCQKLCQAEPLCGYWSYIALESYVGNECFLTDAEGIKHGVQFAEAISGPKNCPK